MTPYVKNDIAAFVTEALGALYPALENASSYADIALPKHASMGDYATSCALKLAKVLGKPPVEIASAVAAELSKNPAFAHVEAAAPGFVNMRLQDKLLLERLAASEGSFALSLGTGKKILLEYCSLNVAKPMHIGHLRNTIFGECIKRLLVESGHEVVTVNHIGDWGTQFGKLIVAAGLYGDKAAIEANPVEEFTKLYVRFHDEAEKDPSLEDKARQTFQQLEQGDPEIRAQWQWIVNANKVYIKETMEDIGVRFDHEIGESFYIEASLEMVKRLEKSGICDRNEDGSLAINFERHGIDLPSALLQKKDGSTLYLTRDIATIDYRVKTFEPDSIVYVVADEQSLHFRQLFALARLAKIAPENVSLVHVNYGLFSLKEGNMSTRKGRVVTARDLLDEALERADAVLKEKGVYDLPEIDAPALKKAIAYGAVFYSDISQNRSTPQVFDWDKILSFEGNSAPYLQYVHARTVSVLRKAREANLATHSMMDMPLPETLADEEHQLLLQLNQWADVIASCLGDYRQNYLAEYLYNLASAFNAFYANQRVIDAPETERNFRLALVARTRGSIAEGLRLMNIDAPERM